MIETLNITLEFFDGLLNINLWKKGIIIYSLLVLVLYMFQAFKTRSVLITKKPSSKIFLADQYYYLPTASIQITATAKVIITRSKGENNIISAKLSELLLENKVTIEPDTAQLLSITYNPSLYNNDELRLNTNASGLLENISVTSDDRVSNIIAAISEDPKKILSDHNLAPAMHGVIEAPNLTTETVSYFNTFFISSEALQKDSIRNVWIINIDGALKENINVEATFEIKWSLPKTQMVDSEREYISILTRPMQKLSLTATASNDEFKGSNPLVYEIAIPDPSIIIEIPVTRSAFVKKINTPKFSNGLLTENYINKPSEIEGFISIPIDVLKAIFSIPAQLLNFRTSRLRQEFELEKVKLDLSKLQVDAKMNDITKNSQELKAKLSTEKVLLDTKKGVLDTKQQIANIEKALEITKWDITNLKDYSKDTASENIPEIIINHAIDKNQKEWKQKYNVLDIGIGKKRINGIETNINCIIFRPIEKIEHGEKPFIPIPATISFVYENRPFQIPIDVQETGGEIFPAFITNENEACELSFPKLPGCSVSRVDNDSTGTIGLKVYKNSKAYILSCYHVLCPDELDNGILKFDPSNPKADKQVISPGKEYGGKNTDGLGEVTEGILDDFLDCALASLKDEVDVEQRICRINQQPVKPITITIDHAKANYRVFMSGQRSKLKSASISSSYTSADINYSIGKKTISGLIATTSLAQRGDSGALVFDQNCYILGIVVACSPSTTYIIPIARIISEFGITLKK